MSEQLENFIKQNKKQFDAFEAPEGLWDKLDNKLDQHCQKQSKRSKMQFLYTASKVAAVLVLAVSFGFLWAQYKTKQATDLNNINPALAAKEVHFTSLIKSKRTALKDLKNVDPQLYKTFKVEQKKLEAEYKSLQEELLTTPNQDKVVKAMIRNLQSQLSLLTQQLDITNEVKQIKSNQNEQNI